MRHLASLFALGLVACYQPHPTGEASCEVACGPAGECPPGMQCAANGFCFGPDVGGCGVSVDGPPGEAGSSTGSDGGSGSDGSNGSGSGTLSCYGTHLQVCFASAPTGDMAISTPINTDADPRCTSVASVTPSIGACFIQGGSIEIEGTVRATGSRPLVLVAAQTITIDDTDVLDLRGDHNARAAGAEINCATNNDGKSGTPAGGGAGGSYATRGGTGGAGGNNGGGNAAGTVQPSYQGGCAGGDGGSANNGNSKGGHGGGGGGAVYLVAGESITISGTINASGEGGSGGARGPQGGGPPGGIHVDLIGGGGGQGGPGGGGGGGGAGGLIGLDAPSVTASGVLIANGGGGGAGGSSDNNGGNGATPDGSTTDPASGATGSGGAGNGGDGYGTTNGAPVQAASASSGGTQNSGGGGGGGGGAIWVYATSKTLSGRISPGATP